MVLVFKELCPISCVFSIHLWNLLHLKSLFQICPGTCETLNCCCFRHLKASLVLWRKAYWGINPPTVRCSRVFYFYLLGTNPLLTKAVTSVCKLCRDTKSFALILFSPGQWCLGIPNFKITVSWMGYGTEIFRGSEVVVSGMVLVVPLFHFPFPCPPFQRGNVYKAVVCLTTGYVMKGLLTGWSTSLWIRRDENFSSGVLETGSFPEVSL